MSKMIQKLEQRQKLNPKQIIEANLMQLNYYSLEKRITKEIRNLLENKYSYVKIKGEFSKIKLWNGHIFTSLKE